MLQSISAIPQFYFEKTQFLLISSISAALVNIGLNFVFIKMFGYVAAGYTTLVCYILYSLGHYIVSGIIIKKNIPGNRLFDKKIILLLSSSVIFVGICCNFIFDFWYIKYFPLIYAVCL
ncbi:MAG: polysaccharide biosynthesis C-terminal domain-containing protein [Alphaproteobacteria bacterium]|nr:polysaccharide biosynthesis C-terminal domain-containing protein [Alphaproteobacteria bacterium]